MLGYNRRLRNCQFPQQSGRGRDNGKGSERMKIRVFLSASMILLGIIPAASGEVTIGVYFDNHGESACIADTTISYPSFFQAFLVAKGLPSGEEITGWEAKLTWSANLNVSLAEIYGLPINALTFPNFMVGLGQGLTDAGSGIPLARLTVVAVGPGEFYLGACDIPSIPNSAIPIFLRGGSLTPFNYEYGGPGITVASYGSLNCPSINNMVLSLTSQFESFEYIDGQLYGITVNDKSMVQLPKFLDGEPRVLTADQIRALALIPSMTLPGLPNKSIKSTTVFSENFENYAIVGGLPFTPLSGQAGVYATSAFGDFGIYPIYYWGATNQRRANGINSAFICEHLQNCDECSLIRNSASYYPTDARGAMTNVTPIDLSGNGKYSCKFNLWSELDSDNTEDNQYDYVAIYAGWTDEFGYPASYPVGTIWYSTMEWKGTNLPLPDSVGDDFEISFNFNSDTFETNDEGVYIDDLQIDFSNVDLQVMSVQPWGPSFDLGDPVNVSVTLTNAGTTPSGDFILAFCEDHYDDTEVGLVQVPVLSVEPGEVRTVDVQVPFMNYKTFFETVTKEYKFILDYMGTVLETDENNNIENGVDLSWSAYNAPVILIHGITGGGLIKANATLSEAVFGEDLNKSLWSMIFTPDRIMRSEETDAEQDAGVMYVPSAYPPEYGFIMNPTISLSRPTFMGIAYGYLSLNFEIPVLGGMWGPLINNLTVGEVGDNGVWVLPNHDPIMEGSHEQDLFLFNYDWRVDINPTRTTTLNGSTPSFARLDSLISWIKGNHPGADRLTIVSHSLGGVLVEAYLKYKGPTHGVYRWITLGSPFQGSANALATLFGANGLGFSNIPYGGALVGRRTGDIYQEYVSGWSLLPTPHSDLLSPEAWNWGVGPSFQNDPEVICQWPCDRYPFLPVYATTTIQNIKTNPLAYEGWFNNPNSSFRSTEFQNAFMSMSGGTEIENVETWAIAGVGKHTLRGVVRYTKEILNFNEFINPGFYRSITHDVAFCSGDGTVPVWSAANVNVAPENLNIRYALGVDHLDLLRNERIGNFVGDLIRGKPLGEYDFDLPRIDPDDQSLEWTIHWDTDVSVWTPKTTDKMANMEFPPISLELIELTSTGDGEILVGQFYLDKPTEEIDVDTKMVTVALDPRFKVFEIGDDIFISSTSDAHITLRVILRPSPMLFDPASPPVAKTDDVKSSGILVGGELRVCTTEGVRTFPGSGMVGDQSRIEFVDLGSTGFQAYVDFEFNGGVLVNDEHTMYIDADGNGGTDYEVTAVDENLLSPLNDSLHAYPNPANSSVGLCWEAKNDDADRLVVFDLRGCKVREYAIDGSEKGRVFFDGRDSAGRELPAGVYVAQVINLSGRTLAKTKLAIVK